VEDAARAAIDAANRAFGEAKALGLAGVVLVAEHGAAPSEIENDFQFRL
jgi:hypothetical protein